MAMLPLLLQAPFAANTQQNKNHTAHGTIQITKGVFFCFSQKRKGSSPTHSTTPGHAFFVHLHSIPTHAQCPNGDDLPIAKPLQSEWATLGQGAMAEEFCDIAGQFGQAADVQLVRRAGKEGRVPRRSMGYWNTVSCGLVHTYALDLLDTMYRGRVEDEAQQPVPHRVCRVALAVLLHWHASSQLLHCCRPFLAFLVALHAAAGLAELVNLFACGVRGRPRACRCQAPCQRLGTCLSVTA